MAALNSKKTMVFLSNRQGEGVPPKKLKINGRDWRLFSATPDRPCITIVHQRFVTTALLAVKRAVRGGINA
jgi:hypothetical protein